MLILSGYGTTTKKYVLPPKRVTTKAPEEPGFFSKFLTQTAEGVVSSVTGQQQAPQYQPTYQPRPSGMFGRINPYYIYAGAGIGVLAILLIIKKMQQKKKETGMVIAQPLQPIQIQIRP